MQQGYDALSSTYGQGRDALSSSLNQGGTSLTNSVNQGTGALNTSYGQGRDAINSNYGAAGDLYKNLLNSYAPGAQAYGDATGANGAAGYGRATANFQTNPGYQFQMDQGLQALDRTHAAAGNLNSGNADTDALKYATGLANQSYGQYTAGLAPYLQGQQGATAGAAGVATGQGGALNQSYDSQGNAINSNYGTIGTGLNNNAQVQGTGLNSSYQGQGAAANANFTGQGASNAAATMNNYNVGANTLNALQGGLNFLSGGTGGQGGVNGLAKNASSLFSAFT